MNAKCLFAGHNWTDWAFREVKKETLLIKLDGSTVKTYTIVHQGFHTCLRCGLKEDSGPGDL